MPDIFTQYEKKLLRQIVKANEKVKGFYGKAINEIALTASKYSYKGVVFDLNKYPLLKSKIEAKMVEMQSSIYTTLVSSINDSWDLSNQKNDTIVNEKLKGAQGPEFLFDHNRPALKEFIKRKEKGLKLSDRVWNALKPYRIELEQALAIGIREGVGAKKMATDMKKYLNEPDRLYRRVRDKKGKLQLSANAKNYHPGRGVYRSSFKNALRLTATDTNIAYRSADHERWKESEIVKGIEIKLSEQHPRYDLCDPLEGEYPKDFKFTGWHPWCICYSIPILTTDKEFDKQLDHILGLTDNNPILKQVNDIPPGASKWIKDNRERVEGWKSKPYFIRDNPEYFSTRNPTIINRSVQENIRYAKENKLDSFDLHKTKNGNFTPERQKLHDRIIAKFTDVETTQYGTIFTMGGAPASGKSTLINSGLLPHPKKIAKIDTDEIKKMLPEYERMVKFGDSKAAAFAHEESSYLGKRIVSENLKRGNDFLLDGIGDGAFESLEKKIKTYQSGGNRVRSDYVTLDTKQGIKNDISRAAATGRKIPRSYIISQNQEVSKLIPQLIKNKTINELYLWDTNINGKPRLIFKTNRW